MNKQKKPAAVAKTAKKRGRPAGVKNKPKLDFPVKVDWEKLAKQLQTALATEIKEHDCAQDVIDTLVAELSRKRTFWERLVCLSTGHI
jgi:hypothetical protein